MRDHLVQSVDSNSLRLHLAFITNLRRLLLLNHLISTDSHVLPYVAPSLTVVPKFFLSLPVRSVGCRAVGLQVGLCTGLLVDEKISPLPAA